MEYNVQRVFMTSTLPRGTARESTLVMAIKADYLLVFDGPPLYNSPLQYQANTHPRELGQELLLLFSSLTIDADNVRCQALIMTLLQGFHRLGRWLRFICV